MASKYAKRGELWLGWIEYQNGKRIHLQVNLNLTDTKQNRKIANELKKNKEYEIKNTPNFYIIKIKVKDAVKTFLETKKKKKKNTYLIYAYSLLKVKEFEEKFLDEINKEHKKK
jgi:hypothetical protein